MDAVILYFNEEKTALAYLGLGYRPADVVRSGLRCGCKPEMALRKRGTAGRGFVLSVKAQAGFEDEVGAIVTVGEVSEGLRADNELSFGALLHEIETFRCCQSALYRIFLAIISASNMKLQDGKAARFEAREVSFS